MSLASGFAEFVCGVSDDTIPAADRAAIEASWFDAIGASFAGRSSDQAGFVESFACAQGDQAEATVLGSLAKLSAPYAAFVNATGIHADDYDDMGGYGHPTGPLAAALMAAAELKGAATGRELVSAYAIGFEVAMTLYASGKYDQYDCCFHSTAVFGTIGATCAVARLLELDVAQCTAALAIAASQSGGLGRNNGTMVKPLHAGIAAYTALIAVQLALEGVRGADDVFEARGGFNETYFQHRALDADRCLKSLGQPFKAAKHLHIKKYPCCGSNQSALDGVVDIVTREQLSYDDIAEVAIHAMVDTSPVLRYPRPPRGLNGKFSIFYTVGNLILKGRLDVDDFTDAETVNPRVVQAMGKVRSEVISRWDKRAAGGSKVSGNPVSITTTDGRTFEAHTVRSAMRGSPNCPLTDDELDAKFRDNAARQLATKEEIDTAVELWRHLDELTALNKAIASTTRTATN